MESDFFKDLLEKEKSYNEQNQPVNTIGESNQVMSAQEEQPKLPEPPQEKQDFFKNLLAKEAASNAAPEQPVQPQEELSAWQRFKKRGEHKPTQEGESIGLAGQFMLGELHGNVTWPADIGRAAAHLTESDLDELEESAKKQGVSFDREKAAANAAKLASYIPVQEDVEKWLQEHGGRRSIPVTNAEKWWRNFGELLSIKGIARAGVNTIRSIMTTAAIRTAAAAAGTTVTQEMEKAGVNPMLANIVGGVVTGVGHAAGRRVLSPAGQDLRNLAQNHLLPEYGFMQSPEAPFLAPKISEGRKVAVQRNVTRGVQSAIDRTVQRNNRMALYCHQGTDIDVAHETARDTALMHAQNIQTPVTLEPVVTAIDRRVREIRGTHPSLDAGQQAEINMLMKYRNDFMNKPVTPKQGPVMYDQYGKPIPQPPPPKPTAKSVSGIELVNQYSSNNIDRGKLYRDPTMGVADRGTDRAIGFVNGHLIEASERTGNTQFADAFREANLIHHEMSNLRQIQSILEPYYTSGNPKELTRILKNRRDVAFLTRALGEDGIRDLQEIGRYNREVSERLNNLFDTGESVASLTGKVGAASAVALVSVSAAEATGVAFGLKKVIPYVKGWVLTTPALRNAYIDMLQALRSGSAKSLKLTSGSSERTRTKIKVELLKKKGSRLYA